MARDLTAFEEAAASSATTNRRRRTDRSTAQALAAALSALAVATLVVNSSSSALDQSGTAVSSDIETGTITLSDDDGGRSLVDLQAMAPGRPKSECINIAYTGTVLPVDVTLAVETFGDIADYVDMTVERGVSGGFGACDLFQSVEVVSQSRLAELSDGVEVGQFSNEGDSMTFRVTFELIDSAAAAGRAGTVDFVWEALPA